MRTEKARALTWDRTHLTAENVAGVVIPRPHRGVAIGAAAGRHQTKRSRRTVALLARCLDALLAHRSDQDRRRAAAGEAWYEHGLVFSSQVGTPMDASNVRRAFRAALDAVPGIDPSQWTLASCDTRSSRYCPIKAFPSTRSPDSSATAAPR